MDETRPAPNSDRSKLLFRFSPAKLREFRSRRDYSLAQLALKMRALAGVSCSRGAISQWERGRNHPSLLSLLGLATVFREEVGAFFEPVQDIQSESQQGANP